MSQTIFNFNDRPTTTGVFRLKYRFKNPTGGWRENIGESTQYVSTFTDLRELIGVMIDEAGDNWGAGVDGISIDFIPDTEMNVTYSMPEGDPIVSENIPEGEPIKSDIMPEE